MTSAHQRPRLLFVCGGNYVYGLERVVLRVVEGMFRRDYDVRCTVSGWNDGVFPAELDVLGVPYSAPKLGWFYLSKPAWTLDGLVHAPSALVAYRRLLADFAPELVFHASLRTLAVLRWMTGPKNVVFVQDYWSPRDAMIVRWCDPSVVSYVACSEDIRAHLLRCGLPAHKITRIYNPAKFGEEVRRIPPDRPRTKPTMGIVGQVIERKGHHTVVEALARVRQLRSDLDFQLRIFGEGPEDYARRVKRLAEQLGLSSRIEWCGYKKSPDEIFPEMDFSLVPTLTPDPFPLAAIEPSVYGITSITSTAGGLAEAVRDGVTGYQVPPGDSDALADRIIRLVSDPDRIHDMGDRAYRENKARFNSTVIMDQYAELIDALLAKAETCS